MLTVIILGLVILLVIAFVGVKLLRDIGSIKKTLNYSTGNSVPPINNQDNIGVAGGHDSKKKKRVMDSTIAMYMSPNRPNAPIYLPFCTSTEWIGSVYDKAPKWVADEASANIQDVHAIPDLGHVALIVYCVTADFKGAYARLKIADPFSSVITEWFSTEVMTPSFISTLTGRIIVIYGFAQNNTLKVDRIRRTIYQKKIS